MINYIKKSPLILLVLLLSNADSLETNKSLELLSTRRILLNHEPFYDVSQNHVATFQVFDVRYNFNLFSFNTYTLDGKALKSCQVPKPDDVNAFASYAGSLTSLGDNQTEVLMWIQSEREVNYHYDIFYLHLRVIKPAAFPGCNDVNDDHFRISSLRLTEEYYGYVVPYVVPYVDSFDIVFPSDRKILKARYDSGGVIIRNPEILAVGESTNISSVNSVIKYDKSSNLLIIYEYPGSNLTAVLANQKGQVLKRKALLELTNDIIKKKYSPKYNTHCIFGEVDHGKLVLCVFFTKVTRCKRYNATTLESEISVELESEELRPFGRIHLLPDGGFLLLQFDTREEDTVYSLTRVNADGSIWKTIEMSTCSVLPMSTYPYIYPKDEGVCLAYMCVGVEPFNMPRNIRPYSTHINCYE